MSENRIKPSLSEFFFSVEKRFFKNFPGEWPSFRVRICNHVIELRFSTVEQMEKAVRPLRGFKVETAEAPDAVFKYCVDDCTKYFVSEEAGARWQIKDGADTLFYIPGVGLSGMDSRRNIFFTVSHFGSKNDPLLYAHPLLEPFEQWGESQGLLLMHSAVVGTDGKGVIIAGYGGAGKSTLAVSCLLAGMDFVSDDCPFFTSDGILEAFPIYTSVCLNQDVLHALNPSMPVIGEYRIGKYVLDASDYNFSSRLAIHGIIVPAMPVVGHGPEIVRIPAMSSILKITLSTIFQTFGLRDPELMQTMISRLKGLPAYEFRQSRDSRKNAEYLRQFIKIKL